jgi:hypothetical protein
MVWAAQVRAFALNRDLGWDLQMRPIAILLMLSLMAPAMAGCLGPSDDEAGIDLVVSFQATNGTLVEYYEEGEYVGQDTVVLSFDFSQTTSQRSLETFGVNRLDGSPGITVNASEGAMVEVEFTRHGLHELALFATDGEQQVIDTITVRMESRIMWTETSTNDPISMVLNTKNQAGDQPASVLVIESTVYNPALITNIGGGQEVDVSWALIDETQEACQSQPGTVEEGGSSTWNTVHFNTYEVHELRITYEDGQDRIDVEQSISIEYERLETAPTG